MKCSNDGKMKSVLTVLLMTSVVSAFSGQKENSEIQSGFVTAAAPRRNLVVVVEVTFPDRNALNELARAGYNISNVQGTIATIHANSDELERLKQTGYPLREIRTRTQGFEPMALGAYHTYDTLTDELSVYAESHPDICRLYTLGQSVQGRELWALLISDNPDEEEDEPEFKYVSTMHGDENLCTEMSLYFIDLLLTEYGTNDRITHIIDNTAIWIVPLMNPDGRESGRRQNANGIDLNRNFPLLTDNSLNLFTGEPLDALNRQPEVRHIMNWTVENSFVLSASFHTGALVVCYPYGYNEQMSAVDTPTPDDMLFEDISRRYAMYNSPMWNSSQFNDGIINAARWYSVKGEMGDWNYRYASCNEVTIELSRIFRPSATQIPTLWSQNRESMLSFLESVHMGARGMVTEKSSGEPLWAEVRVEGNNQPVFTDPDVGDYHRMLLPGTYDLVFHVPGYLPRRAKNIIVTDGPATRVNIELIPEQASPDFYRDGTVNIKDLEILIEYWGQGDPLVDIAPLPEGDGIVDEQDLTLLMEYWQEDIPELGLIAHWPLDETEGIFTADRVGDNDASVVGDATWQPDSGQLNGALELDGVDDCAITDPVLNPADGPFSVFAWVKGGAPGQVILSQTEGTDWLFADQERGVLGTALTIPTKNVRGKIKVGPSLISQATITDDNWHRVGFVWDGTNRILYVDDVEVTRDTIENIESSTGGLHIGAGSQLDQDTFWSGMIDDVRIYNRVVTP